jgi:hypothetical protein
MKMELSPRDKKVADQAIGAFAHWAVEKGLGIGQFLEVESSGLEVNDRPVAGKFRIRIERLEEKKDGR